MRARSGSRWAGFTLLELVAVIAIMAILVSIALPTYQAFMKRVHRTEAVVALLDVASCQERVFAMTGRYDTTQCIPGGLEHYSVRINPSQTSDSLLFTAWADPIGGQVDDSCGSLGLNQAGMRQVTSDAMDAQACWRIR